MAKDKFNDFLVEVLIIQNGGQSWSYYVNDKQCTICWENLYSSYAIKMCCDHYYHRECLMNYLKKYKNAECVVRNSCIW